MITILKQGDRPCTAALELEGKSTDIKPTVKTADGTFISNGSTYYEIDGQHRLFIYDEETHTWCEQ